MSVEFRQRTIGEYVQIVWNRKWLILLPTIAIATAIAWVVYRLPNVYESTTLVVVKPPTIPNAIVPRLSDTDLALRLNNITQIVTSRTTLQPLIERYPTLYQLERSRGESVEALIEKMRKDMSVGIEARENFANAFVIKFKGRDPRTTQAITAELASQYIAAETTDTTQTSSTTKQFFEDQIKQAKDQLEEIDTRRVQYMQRNLNNLPSSAGSLLGQLSGLRDQQRTLMMEMGRLRDQRTALSNQLADLEKQSEQDRFDVIEQVTDPKSTTGYAQLASRKAQLEAEYQNMLVTLKPKNPDVIAKKAELTAIQREIDQLVEEGKSKLEERRKRVENRTDPRIVTLRGNLKLVDGELIRQQKSLDLIDKQIGELQERINTMPSAEIELDKLNRDYTIQKTRYDDLLAKKVAIDLSADVATNQQGEKIQVIDPANFPERPVAPKRPLLMAMGVALGLAVGLLLAGLVEVPRLLTIQSTRDAEYYTGMPVLISVPELLTPRERRMRSLRR